MRLGVTGMLAMFCLGCKPACADGPTPLQLQTQLQAGPTSSDVGAERARAVATEAAIAGLASTTATVAAGAVQAAQGNASNTLVLPAANGATAMRALSARAGDRVSISDYAATGAVTGGGIILDVLQAQAAGDRVAQVASVTGLVTGRLVTSPLLPAGTTITSVGGARTVTVSQATSAATLTDPELHALMPMPGMANALRFAAVFDVPAGATITGAGIPAGAIVAAVTYPDAGGTTVFMSSGVATDVASGATVSFGYTAAAVLLSAAWSGAVPAGAQVGVATQDDWPAFQNATFFLAPEHGGPGGTIWVPSGTYYLSAVANSYNGVSYEFGSNVRFVPGSASTDTVPLGISDTADLTVAGSARNPVATSLVVAQNYFQQTQQTLQDQALLVTQNNVNCVNDGGGNGCGMVGAEVKQGIAAALDRGILWAYHSTDDVQQRQSVAWAGAELELRNNSGIDWMWNSTFGNKTGLHIDDLGNTANTVALMAGGNAPTGGGWHRSMDCNHITILDYCFDIQDGPLSGTGLEPVVVAALDMSGRYTGTALSIHAQAASTNRALAATGAAIDAAGNVGALSLSTQAITAQTAILAAVAVQDGGATDTPYALSVQPPASGTAATVAATGYSLRSLQGAGPINVPAGMASGDVYTIPGGTCTVQPQVTYGGGSWSISAAGSCTIPPIGTQAAPIAATGGSASVAPRFWPMWQMTGISVTGGGSGYNPAVPPVVQALTAGTGIVLPKLVPAMTSAAAPLAIASGANAGLLVATSGAVTAPNGLAVTGGATVDTLAASGAVRAATIQPAGSLILAPTAASYVIQQSDCGTTLEPQPTAAMSIAVPATLALGCRIDVIQVNTQQIAFAGQAGMTLRSLNGATKLSGLYGRATILVDGGGTFSVSGNIQ